MYIKNREGINRRDCQSCCLCLSAYNGKMEISLSPRQSRHAAVRCIVHVCVCVCMLVISFILDVRLVDAPAGVTQEEGHT